jgi:hypothetical protein
MLCFRTTAQYQLGGRLVTKNDGLQGFVISPMHSPWSNCIEAVILLVFFLFDERRPAEESNKITA